jgi:hypothetical protein
VACWRLYEGGSGSDIDGIGRVVRGSHSSGYDTTNH